MQETVKTEEKKNVPLFVLKVVGNVIFYAIILFLLFFSIMNIRGGSKTSGKFPNLFGKGFLTVASESMDVNVETNVCSVVDEKHPYVYANEDYSIKTFGTNDLLYAKVFNGKDCSSLKVGDVVTFKDKNLENQLNTHRIIYVGPNSSYVVTMGDQKAQEMSYLKQTPYVDADDLTQYSYESAGYVQIISAENIAGVITGVNYGGGATIKNIQKNWLFYFVVPVLIVLLFEVFMVVKNIMDLKGAKQQAELESNKETMMADLEAQKEEMRKQILAELAAAQGITLPADKPAEEPKTEEPAIEEAAPVEEPVVEEVPAEEATVAEEVAAEPVEEVVSEPEVTEEPATEETAPAEEPAVEETPVVEEAKVEEPVAEEAPVKKPAAKKTTTTAKKTTTTKKAASTDAPKKTTTAKKTTSTATKKSTGTTTKKTTTTKKATTKTEE